MDLNKIKVVTYVKDKKLQDEIIKLAINADIVFFDRFDLYATEELTSSLVELSKSKLIILDYKHKSSCIMKVYKILNVTLTDKEMRVY